MFTKTAVIWGLLAFASANPAPKTFSSTLFGSTVEEMRALCDNDDALACLKFKAVNFLESLFQQDTFKLSDDVEVRKNSYRANEGSARAEESLEDKIEEYVKGHDATVELPGATVTLQTEKLDQDELGLNVKLTTNAEARGKSKIKKIMIPILIFVLLKAITLIPLALGVLGLKAWNALQLSFFSFIVSIALAVFQLCKKIAADNAHPQIAPHGWESYSSYKRSLDVQGDADSHKLAYSAYSNN